MGRSGRKPEFKSPVPFRLIMENSMRESLRTLQEESGISMSKLVRDAVQEKYFDAEGTAVVLREVPDVAKRALTSMNYMIGLMPEPTDSVYISRSKLSLVLNQGRWDDLQQVMRNVELMFEMKGTECLLEVDEEEKEKRGFYIRFMEKKVSKETVEEIAASVTNDYLVFGGLREYSEGANE